MFWYKLWWGKNALASWVFQQAKEELAVREVGGWCLATKELVPSGEVLDDRILGGQAGMEVISGYQCTCKGRM